MLSYALSYGNSILMNLQVKTRMISAIPGVVLKIVFYHINMVLVRVQKRKTAA